MSLNNRGFSLVEILVSMGITGIITLGAGQFLIQSYDHTSMLEMDSASQAVAQDIKYHLKDEASCHERIDFKQFDLEASQTSDGTPITINMRIPENFTLESGAFLKMGRVSAHFNNVRLANVLVISSNNTETEIVGDLLFQVLLERERDERNRRNETRRVFNKGATLKSDINAGRINLKISNDGSINSCNTPLELDVEAQLCEDMGAEYEAACENSPEGCCVWKFKTDDGDPVDFCRLGEAGVVGPDGEKRCETMNSVCPEAASGISLGNFDCKDMVPHDPDNQDANNNDDPPVGQAPGPVSPDGPPIPDGTEPECFPAWQAYSSCMALQIASNNYVMCELQRPPTSNCSEQVQAQVPATIADQQAVVANDCDCGSGRIAEGDFCGFCTMDLDYGYGFFESLYEVRQCQSGALRLVPNAQGVIPQSSVQCSGARRRVIDRGGGRYAF